MVLMVQINHRRKGKAVCHLSHLRLLTRHGVDTSTIEQVGTGDAIALMDDWKEMWILMFQITGAQANASEQGMMKAPALMPIAVTDWSPIRQAGETIIGITHQEIEAEVRA